MLKLQL